MKVGLILIVFLQGLSVWAVEFTARDAFVKSLTRLESHQTPSSSCSIFAPPSSTCSTTVRNLVKDDNGDRYFGQLKSQAEFCRKDFAAWKKDIKNPELLQEAFASTQFSSLGKFSNETAKSCLWHADTKSNDVISKFYYYTARLNENAAKVSEEQIYLDRYLNEKDPTICPNPYTMAAANAVCQKTKACPQTQDYNALVKQVTADEAVFDEVSEKLKNFPDGCDEDESCAPEKNALRAVYAGLVAKNPWFTNMDFEKTNKSWPVAYRLREYMQLARENLRDQQARLQKAALCIHGANKPEERCDLSELRETLASTMDLPTRIDGDTTSQVMNHYIQYQSCLEDKSLDRNRTGKILTESTVGIATAILSWPIAARMAAAKAGKVGVTGLLALFGTDLGINVFTNRDAWKTVISKCLTHDDIAFDFKERGKNICENADTALSSGEQVVGACMVNAGLLALSTVTSVNTGSSLMKSAQKAGYINPSLRAVESTERATMQGGTFSPRAPKNLKTNSSEVKIGTSESVPQRRTTDAVSASERRTGQVTPPSCGLCHTENTTEITSIPNPPSSVKIIEGQRPDGSKALYYRTPEKLADGSWVAVEHEFQIDEITGGINANYPAGRVLFEKIAKEKAGKAYFAFFDVGSLGFVNNRFKAGTAAGDRYLKGVAEKILKLGGGKITLARTGGDEFGLIVDEVDPAKAHALIVKIQEEIRKDLKGEAKRIFFEEKVARAQEFREGLKKLESENPNGVTTEQKAALLQDIRDLSHVQQPDVSIGITQIGHEDLLTDLSLRAEPQATQMKISSALQAGRSAEKYGSKEVPNVRPNNKHLSVVQAPTDSPSWAKTASASSAPPVDSLRLIGDEPKQELARFSDISVVLFEDELGRFSYKTERFVTDAVTGKRVPVISEIPTRGRTGLLDGTHVEGQHLISGFVDSASSTALIMPKLKSLKYLNYFESGTQAGDEMLEAVADVIKKNTRSTDLNFKLNGADFLMGVKNRNPHEMKELEQRISEQLKSNPKVLAVLERESAALTAKLAVETAKGNRQAIAQVQQRLQDLKNFNLDLQFQTMSKSELGKNPTLKDIQSKFDQKFKN